MTHPNTSPAKTEWEVSSENGERRKKNHLANSQPNHEPSNEAKYISIQFEFNSDRS